MELISFFIFFCMMVIPFWVVMNRSRCNFGIRNNTNFLLALLTTGGIMFFVLQSGLLPPFLNNFIESSISFNNKLDVENNSLSDEEILGLSPGEDGFHYPLLDNESIKIDSGVTNIFDTSENDIGGLLS